MRKHVRVGLGVLAVVLGLTVTSLVRAQIFQYPFDTSTNLLTVGPTVREGLLREGDTISVTATNNNTIRLLNLDGVELYRGSSTNFHLARGHYLVETPGDRTQFVVLPDDYAGAPYSGTEPDTGVDATVAQRLIEMQPALVRIHGGGAGVYWDEVQPSSNVWDWTKADITMAESTNRQIIWSAFIRPTWQTNDAEFIPAFAEYVRRVAERYQNQLYAIEIWNEICWGCGPQSLPVDNNPDMAAFYKNMLQASYTAIKGVSTNIQVYALGYVHGWAFDPVVQMLGTNGAAAYMDGVTWHDYGICNNWRVDQDTTFVNDPKWGTLVVPKLSSRIQTYRSLFPGKELLIDELALCGASALEIPTDTNDWYSSTDWHRGMSRSIKVAVIGLANGLRAMMPHIFAIDTTAPPNYEGYGWEFRSRGPHPKTSAWLMSCYWLNNSRLVTTTNLNDLVYLYAWKRANGNGVIFAWTVEGYAASFAPVASLQPLDVFGESVSSEVLTEEPYLFHTSGAVTDSQLTSLTDQLLASIQSVSSNSPPVLASIGSKAVTAGQLLGFVVSATDPDGDPLTFTASPLPAGATFNTNSQTFAWTPSTLISNSQVGVYNVLFGVSDGELTDSELVQITVSATGQTNHPPVLASIGNKDVATGQLLFFTVSATDPDGNALTYSAAPLPAGATFNPINRSFSWLPSGSPENNQSGTYPVTFTVSDGQLTDSEQISIVAHLPLNQPPVLAPIGSKTVAAGQLLNFTVSATDPENNPLTYSAAPLPAGATFSTSTHTFNWTPSVSQTGSYFVTFTVADASSNDVEQVRIDVGSTAGNQAPVLSPIGEKTVTTGNLLTFTVSATDPNADPLTYSAAPLPAGAMFDTTTHIFSWTPSGSVQNNQAGTYFVTFSVSDGALTTSEQVRINVPAPTTNQPPVLATIGDKTVNENQLLTFTVSGSDPEGQPLTYSVANLPSGAAFNPTTHTFSWTPAFSQAGGYQVTFTVSDGSLSASQMINITVVNVDRAPTLSAIGNKSVRAQQLLSFAVSGGDPDGDALTYSASGLPSGATFNTGTHVFSWTPTSAQTGSYNLTFTVSDGSLTASETITITINNNQPPVWSRIGNKTVVRSHLLTFTVSASDPNGDPLTYSTGALPLGATFNASTRTFSWTPRSIQTGNWSVTFRVSDGQLTVSQSITITVTH